MAPPPSPRAGAPMASAARAPLVDDQIYQSARPQATAGPGRNVLLIGDVPAQGLLGGGGTREPTPGRRQERLSASYLSQAGQQQAARGLHVVGQRPILERGC